jgi:hypothetical protein
LLAKFELFLLPAIGEVPLPKFQTLRGFITLFEQIYFEEPIFSNIGEGVQ